MFELYYADCTGQKENCLYPHRITVAEEADLRTAAGHDYVAAEYRDHYRSNANFLRSNCVALDFDNDHSEDPADWIHPEDIRAAFPGVTLGIHYSRNHMKEKNGNPPRPKFHVLLEIDPVTDAAAYRRVKERAAAFFPQCDANALDAARFFFGTKEPEVAFHPGTRTLNALLDAGEEEPFDAALPQGSYGERVILEGSRNATLSRTAGKLVKRFGWNAESREMFLREAGKCVPPLPEEELERIWCSAGRFAKIVQSQEGYIPPERYLDGPLLRPDDYSDIGQAKVLARDCASELLYTAGTDFLTYNGMYWDGNR